MTDPKKEPCDTCGVVHGPLENPSFFKQLGKKLGIPLPPGSYVIPMPGGLFGPGLGNPFGGNLFGDPKTAWLKVPLGASPLPLTASEAAYRWRHDQKRPHHRECRRLATLNTFLDYGSCDHCERSLTLDDVFWRGV